jgi:predicted nucleic acid-binding protein
VSDVFVDANILVYAFSTDPRSDTALTILGQRHATSVQAINEMVWSMRRKQKLNWDELATASRFVSRTFSVIHPLDMADHQTALELIQGDRFAWWDAVMIATALRVGARTFLSEDMHHGLVIGRQLAIVNPFRA